MSFEHYQPREQHKTTPPPILERVCEREPQPERFVSLSDIHNDLRAMQASLEQKKLTDSHGDWRKGVRDVHLVITGDSINKESPNPKVLTYLHHLEQTAPEGCVLTILVGNHELDILTRETQGHDVGLKRKHLEVLEHMQVVCKKGPILFLHRYPSLPLIEELATQYNKENGDVHNERWNINTRFKNAMQTRKINPEISLDVFHSCDTGGETQALEGLSTEAYYEKYGARIRALLERMGVTVIVHGHKRQVSGGQHFEEYIPGIVMINNDTGVSSDKNPEHKHRIASADISLSPHGTDITCIYKKDTKKTGNAEVKQRTIH